VLLAGALVATSCVDLLVGGDPDDSPEAVFERVWSDFDRNYSFFEYKGIDWNAVHEKYAPQARAAQSLDALAPIIGAMFTELNDLHVDLTTSSKIYPSVDFTAVHTFWSPATILKSYVPVSTMTASKNIRYGKLSNDVGWIWIASFAGNGWAGEIDEALDGLAGVTGLVIDVRDNGGGSTDNSEPIAGRFVPERRVSSYYRYRNGPRHSDFTQLYERYVTPATRQFTGKIVVLMNRRCASATENFLFDMRANAAITLVGDTSAGAMGNPMTRELPKGWLYRLPQWIEYDANQRILENIGIAPDVVVKLTAADSTAGRDLQLERALALARP
jgi:hypothetical protein